MCGSVPDVKYVHDRRTVLVQGLIRSSRTRFTVIVWSLCYGTMPLVMNLRGLDSGKFMNGLD